MGIDPITHKPINDAVHGHSANLNHMTQWETARLQAEARLARHSKLRFQINQLGSFSSQPSPARLILNKITPPPSVPPCLDVLKAWQNSWSSSMTSKSSTSTTITTAENMYDMMLATDDGLKSPTSTLCLPDTIFLNYNSIDNSNMNGLINESLLPSSNCTNAAPENSAGSLLGDGNDIMEAVEAFRSEGYNYNNSMQGLHNNIENVLVYGFNNENSPQQQNQLGAVLNGGEEGNTNFEEKHYWETILNLLNDFPSDHLHFPCLI